MNEHKHHEHKPEMKAPTDLPKVRAKLEEMAKAQPMAEWAPAVEEAVQLKRIAEALEAMVAIWRSEIARTMR
jgi:hypothetical protein